MLFLCGYELSLTQDQGQVSLRYGFAAGADRRRTQQCQPWLPARVLSPLPSPQQAPAAPWLR